MNRALNFYPGPASIPIPVMERIHTDLFNYNNTGISVMELSHRTDEIQFIIDDATDRIKRLMGLGSEFDVVLLQGGGSLQFIMVPMNFSNEGDRVDYVNTGHWTQRAIDEAKILNRNVEVIASSEDRDYCYIPKDINFHLDAKYVHICTNNSVHGTQYHQMPDVSAPVVADMSSDIMSRQIDPSLFGCIYAHSQKNIGLSGVTVVIVRKNMLQNVPDGVPLLLDYRTHIENHSNYHTPPCFSIYVVWLIMQWLEDEIGGIEQMETINQEKAATLYNYIDDTSFYNCPVEQNSRSMMNVVFNLPSEDLERQFIQQANEAGIMGTGGHRSIGGCRVSLYNAVTIEAVKKLIIFMYEFQKSEEV